jgi:hypothetical protein
MGLAGLKFTISAAPEKLIRATEVVTGGAVTRESGRPRVRRSQPKRPEM